MLTLLGQAIWSWTHDAASSPERTLISPTATTRTGAPQRWGDVSIEEITLERPDAFIHGHYEHQRWFFPGHTPEQLAAFFAKCDLTPDQRQQLMTQETWERTARGIYVDPSTNVTFRMSPAARQQIYHFLANYPENTQQQYPFRVTATEADHWFVNSGLADSTIEMVNRLFYQEEQVLLFADMEYVGSLPREEQVRLVKALSRVPAALMSLRIQPGQDVGPLVRYWSGPGTSNEVKALLESAAKSQSTATLDVALLLPPFARMRLYQFPQATNTNATREDCFWSALNFFSETPNARFSDPNYRVPYVLEQYDPAAGEPRYGDLVVFLTGDQNPIHCGIYVAADVVFTKNGGHWFQPWTLMHLKDLMAAYSTYQPLRVVIYRKKP